MVTYRTPGVYVEEVTKFPPSVAAVDTAIPAFIGYTARATHTVDDDLRLRPKRIESLPEFERYFGRAQPETGITVDIQETTDGDGNTAELTANAALDEDDRSKHILYYAMQHFYANGGKSCFVVSVGPHKALGTALVAAEMQAGLEPLSRVDEPTLIVIPEAQLLDDIDDFAALQDAALAQCDELMDRFVIMDVHGGNQSLSDPGADLATAVANFRNSGPNQSLTYGAAYAPNLETVLNYEYDETQTVVSHTIDGDSAATTTTSLSNLNDETHADHNNDLYERSRAAIRRRRLILPPSPAVAGIYARVDADRGVWKAPANVGVTGAKPTIEISHAEQAGMNIDPTAGKSVNAVRTFVGKGTLVWGARTLAGNDNEWRYVSVRRFFNFVEESVKKATEHFTFEPNDANTWVRVQAMIENFLTTQWRAGALQGIKPEHAFYVAVGLGKTMTPLDILEGRMIVEVGMAAVRPAEFIILRFSHMMAES